MNAKAGDIVQHQNSIWLSQDFLLGNTGTTPNYLYVAKSRAKRSPDEEAIWKFIELQNKCYFALQNLPRGVKSQLPNSNELYTKAIDVKDDFENLVATAINSTYRLFAAQYGDIENKKSRMALMQSAALIHEAKRYCDSHNISFSHSAFFKRLGHEIAVNEFKYLPREWRNLRNKVRSYAEGASIRELIYPKNLGNRAASRFRDDGLVTGWLLDLACSPKNYSNSYMYRAIRRMCGQHGIHAPSIRWVNDYLSSPATQFLVEGRYGRGSRHNARYRNYTPKQSALYAGDCWQVDGSRVNITDHTVVTTKDGKRKSRQEFLYVVVVRDVMSGEILGREYCHEESSSVVIGAVANAVQNTGYLPYELVYDRFPGHTSPEWAWIESGLQRKGVITTKTSDANEKAQVERWFGTLQDVFMSESNLYYGHGIRSTRRYAHRSKEYVQQMRVWAREHHFDFDAATRETDKILEAYCTTPLSDYSRKFTNINKSPAQLHEESDKPAVTPIAEHEYCFLFGLRKGVSPRNYMIQTQIEGTTYYYGIDDCEVAERFTGVKLTNCFDPENLRRVHLFNGEEYLGTFDEVPRAQVYGPKATRDMRGVGVTKSIGRKMADHRQARRQEATERKEAALKELEGEMVDEIAMMSGGRLPKQSYEAAESAWLKSEWEPDPEEGPTEPTRKTNIRKHY